MSEKRKRDVEEYHKIRMTYLYEDSRKVDEGVIQLALISLRALTLLNGGAILALLTFIGNAGEDGRNVQALECAFLLYGMGLTAGLFATFAAYFAQSLASEATRHDAEFIYFGLIDGFETSAEERQIADKKRPQSLAARYVSIALSLISGVLFGAGLFQSLNGIV